jgi:hypothetical protein
VASLRECPKAFGQGGQQRVGSRWRKRVVPEMELMAHACPVFKPQYAKNKRPSRRLVF